MHSREKAPDRMIDLFKGSMASLAVANTSGDNAQFSTAQVKLEMLLGFFNQFAGACARSSFYHYERACAAEGASIDLVRQGNQGSYYAGPRVAIVLPETVEEAMDAIGQFLSTLYNAGISGCSQWFKGINSVLGVQRTGIYGGARQVTWAADDGVIGRSSTPGHRWAWQTRAWSGGARAPMAVLYQATVVTASDPGTMIGDIHVDEDDILAADYGQWDLAR